MDPVPVTPFYDSHGTVVRLGKKIGSGGEGDVYKLLLSPKTTVAKIYKKPLDEKKQEKLRLMARGCNDDLKGISAWPTDVSVPARAGGRRLRDAEDRRCRAYPQGVRPNAPERDLPPRGLAVPRPCGQKPRGRVLRHPPVRIRDRGCERGQHPRERACLRQANRL